MKPILSFLVLLVVLVLGCTSRRARQEALSAKNQAQHEEVSSPTPQISSAHSAALENQIKEIAAEAKGKVGVTAVALESGETMVSLNPHEHFPMHSVYKLPISMAVMKHVDAGKIKLS